MDDLAEFLSPEPDDRPHRCVAMERGRITAFGADTVTIDYAGGTGYSAGYGSWYIPVVGDQVLLLAGGGDLFVLGKVR